jgi:Domain of unknown function (DUF4276)
LKKLKIHTEGCNNRKDYATMRDAFHSFLGVNRSVEIVLWGSRQNAYEKFKEALIYEPEREHLLLVDSEAPFKENQTPWLHVKNRDGDGWDKPKSATDNHLYFMAQCVEAWLVADEEKLREFYGNKLGNLPKTKDVEEIPKVEMNGPGASPEVSPEDCPMLGQQTGSTGRCTQTCIHPIYLDF